tara:strand:- start:1721 stop:2137 length:417 start_codon:yes stop_codon:yes gene_type:complete
MADDDLPTRVTLVERTMVSREQIVEREERLLARFEELTKRLNAQAADDQRHTLKVFSHEIGEQFRSWADKIHSERDDRDEKREAEVRAKQALEEARRRSEGSPIRGWIAANWMWVGGIGILVVLLRPDLATAVVRVVM